MIKNIWLIVLFLGCQERQAPEYMNINKSLNEALSRELNNKAEKLLDSDPGSALKLLDSALKIKSDDYITYFNIGHVYISQKEYLKTIDTYKQMQKINPDFVQGITFLGMLYEKTGHPDSAKLKYQKAIAMYDTLLKKNSNALDPGNTNRMLALYLLDTAVARPQIENLLVENPQNGLLKILNKSSRAQVVNGFLPD